jgi:hypothetical protein
MVQLTERQGEYQRPAADHRTEIAVAVIFLLPQRIAGWFVPLRRRQYIAPDKARACDDAVAPH